MPGHNNSGSTSYSYPAGDFWSLATKTDIPHQLHSVILQDILRIVANYGECKACRNVQTAHFPPYFVRNGNSHVSLYFAVVEKHKTVQFI